MDGIVNKKFLKEVEKENTLLLYEILDKDHTMFNKVELSDDGVLTITQRLYNEDDEQSVFLTVDQLREILNVCK